MSIGMSTRNPQNVKIDPKECTEFQVHKNHRISGILKKKVFDFNEYRLQKIIDSLGKTQAAEEANMILQQYKEGIIAIGWQRGNPLIIKVTKDK